MNTKQDGIFSSSQPSIHIPILIEPILKALCEPFLHLPENSEPHYFVDCTLGGGGHTQSVVSFFSQHPHLKKNRVLAFDQDSQSIERAKLIFSKEIEEGRMELVHSRFSEAKNYFNGKKILGLLADLGFSSDQLEDSSRGLSFQNTGPLDMRLDPSQGQSCYDLLQDISEKDLERILREWGEERFSRRIASSIVYARSEGRLPKTTSELVHLIVKAFPAAARHGKIHIATRTFQALRIAVNNELDELDALLQNVLPAVQTGGRVAIISFHSLEDRKVKWCLKDKNFWEVLSKKPIQADENEMIHNVRSRSAKLRIAQKLH